MEQWEYRCIDCEFQEGNWRVLVSESEAGVVSRLLDAYLCYLGQYGWELGGVLAAGSGEGAAPRQQLVMKRAHRFLPSWMPQDEEMIRLVLDAPPAIRDVLHRLDSPNPADGVASAAIQLLELEQHPVSREIMAAMLRHPAYRVARSSALALAKMKDPRCSEVLIAILKEPDNATVGWKEASEALSQLNDPATAPAIAELLAINGDTRYSGEVALSLIRALGNTGGEDAVKALRDIVTQVQKTGKREACFHERRALGGVRVKTRHGERLGTIIQALGKVGDQATLRDLLVAQAFEDMKGEVLLALGQLGDTETLVRHVMTLEPQLRGPALQAWATAKGYVSGGLPEERTLVESLAAWARESGHQAEAVTMELAGRSREDNICYYVREALLAMGNDWADNAANTLPNRPLVASIP